MFLISIDFHNKVGATSTLKIVTSCIFLKRSTTEQVKGALYEQYNKKKKNVYFRNFCKQEKI